jgi:hypothetical protein
VDCIGERVICNLTKRTSVYNAWSVVYSKELEIEAPMVDIITPELFEESPGAVHEDK